MDIRARYEDVEEMIETALDGRQAQMWTAIPVKVVKDSDGHTVSLQPLIKSVRLKEDGTREFIQHPVIDDAPVHFGGGGGVTMTHPIKQNDEGIALVMSRSIDVWHQQGDVQQQIDARMHDLSDAVYIPGIRSTPRKLTPAPSTTSTQIRSDDGNHFVDLHPTNGVTVKSSQAITSEGGTTSRLKVGTMTVTVSSSRVDLGGTGGSAVQTVAGPSTKVFAVI